MVKWETQENLLLKKRIWIEKISDVIPTMRTGTMANATMQKRRYL